MVVFLCKEKLKMTTSEPQPSRVIAPGFPGRSNGVETGSEVTQNEVRTSGFYRKAAEVAMGNETLIDPAVSIATIHAMLEAPDSEGRFLPEIKIPEGSLEDYEGEGAQKPVFDSSGRRVGIVNMRYDSETRSGFFGGVEIRPGDAKQGYGTSAYLETALEFLEAGADFRNDPAKVTGDARKMWHKLRDAGLAVVVEEFQETGPDEYTGYYVINGNNLPKSAES